MTIHRSVFLFAFLSVACGQAFGQGNDAAKIDRIIRDSGYGNPDQPGLCVAVVRDGKVIFRKGYGLANLEKKTSITPRTNFRLASMSKQFTATAVLLLKEEGKLRLEDRLTDFFPDFPAYGKEITVRHLLNHSSGLAAYELNIPAGQTAQLNDQDVVGILKSQSGCAFPPGSQFAYSNSGYVMLGLIVAKVSGQPFSRFMTERIFRPLRMSNTVIFEPTLQIANRAYGYQPKEKGFELADQSLTSATQGDGCIYSSIDDMVKWEQAMATSKLLPKASLDGMFARQKYGDQEGRYGFGWFVDSVGSIREIWHGGVTMGFRTRILRYPDRKFTVIVLSNRNDDGVNKVAGLIARGYIPELNQPGS